MTVDLSAGTEGIVEFDGGPKFYSLLVEPIGKDVDDRVLYQVRWESGLYKYYYHDGMPLITSQRKLIAFTPMKTPIGTDLPTEATP